LGPYPKGEIEEICSNVRFKYQIAKQSDFVGRNEDLYKLANYLTQKHRLITVTGLPGIGKSSICKQLGYFFSERDFFRDGVIFIQMSGSSQAGNLFDQILNITTRS